jgi:hypothetical protein
MLGARGAPALYLLIAAEFYFVFSTIALQGEEKSCDLILQGLVLVAHRSL